MIQEITIKNYRSYRDENTFSFEATEDTLDLEGHSVLVGRQIKKGVEEEVRLLKFGVVYGANASGKSNLLEVFNALHSFWNGKTVEESGLCEPFKLNNETGKYSPCEFNLLFWIGKIQFKYFLSVCDNQVSEESLAYDISYEEKHYLVNVMNSDLIRREKSKDKEKSEIYTFFIEDEDNEEVDEHWGALKSFFTSSLTGYYYLPELILDEKIRNAFLKNILNAKDNILDFFSKYDFNIIDIMDNSVITKKKLPELYTLHKFSDPETREEKSDWLPLLETDSKGTISLMILIFLLSYRRGSAYTFKCFDELESSLHPEIVEHLIDEYMHNPIYANSQLLITTHETSLLRTTGDLLRPDEIWFTDKGDDGATSLYSLADFKDLEEVKDFQGAYLHGVFGAVPKKKRYGKRH